jgi:hypothetical protein
MTEEAETQDAHRRIMVVAAHPDDAEFGCGGTVARWVSEGATAYYLICTNGDKGTDELGISAEELAKVRDREQRAAAEALGVSEVVILPRRDGELVYSIDLRGDVVRWIRTWRPDAVFTHDPTVIISLGVSSTTRIIAPQARSRSMRSTHSRVARSSTPSRSSRVSRPTPSMTSTCGAPVLRISGWT